MIKNSLVVALTGQIGSGKSEAAHILQQLGAAIIDADVLAREVVIPGSHVLKKIEADFGKEFILPDGSLNRKLLGELVFQSEDKRRQLEETLHPVIRALYLKKLFELGAKNIPLIVYVVPLLFESRFQYDEVDKIVVISASKETCISRIMSRDGCTKELAEKKYSSQLPIEIKEGKGDFIIRNDGGKEELTDKIQELYKLLLINKRN